METPAAAPAKSILIVEDDALLLLTLRHQFERAGYAVTTAANGAEGRDAFFKERPSIVLADVMMPSLDGIAMLEEIRAREEHVKTPFVFLSNSNDMDFVARAAENGSAAYLLKSDRQIDSIVPLVEEKARGLTQPAA